MEQVARQHVARKLAVRANVLACRPDLWLYQRARASSHRARARVRAPAASQFLSHEAPAGTLARSWKAGSSPSVGKGRDRYGTVIAYAAEQCSSPDSPSRTRESGRANTSSTTCSKIDTQE